MTQEKLINLFFLKAVHNLDILFSCNRSLWQQKKKEDDDMSYREREEAKEFSKMRMFGRCCNVLYCDVSQKTFSTKYFQTRTWRPDCGQQKEEVY